MQIWKTTSAWFQLFRYVDYHFVNAYNKKALSASEDVEGQKVVVTQRQNVPNQRWRIVYLDEEDAEPTQGLNAEFGFWINRPFYLISRLNEWRVIEIAGGENLLLKKRIYNRKEQLFFFDLATKTLRSVAYPDKSIDITDSGKGPNL